MTDPGDAVRRLLDLEEIRTLKARYLRCVDLKLWDELRACFTDDAVMEVPRFPNPDQRTEGAQAIAEFVRSSLEASTSVHQSFCPEIEVDGDRATAIWAMSDHLVHPPDERGRRQHRTGYGHYRERYRRVDGRWRIEHLHLTRLRVDDRFD